MRRQGWVTIDVETLALYVNVAVATRHYCADEDDGTLYDRMADASGQLEAHISTALSAPVGKVS